ncbi:hypothetical protein TNCV_643221 [Trichonephila clavipes]|nr:hypothetical protein TNCV_643221 [Trichonephila clavipes]
MPKSNVQGEKKFHERKKELAANPFEKSQKNSANSSIVTTECPSDRMTEYRARIKSLQNIVLMLSLMTDDGNVIETPLMTAHINTNFVDFSVP